MKLRLVVMLALASLGAGVALVSTALSASPAAAVPLITRTSSVAGSSVCDSPQSGSFVYHYPIRPFDQQHPIRGFFGDPRTLTTEEFAQTSSNAPGSFGFHNGVDITAAAGTPVYPVVSGVVSARLYADEVTVQTRDGRRFQYYHLRPVVHLGQRVIVDRTVLGYVLPIWLHVHLTEIDFFRTHNPVDPGHLEPYQDHTPPFVSSVLFRTPDGRGLDPLSLHGRVDIAADAADTPPVPVPGFWYGFPVTPAVVGWRLVRADGRVVMPQHVVVDFRRTEPNNREFWQVYASGTYQNFPVFGHRFYWRIPGRYLFRLTRQPLDTNHLRNGQYLLTVDVADVCGNRASLTERIVIAHGSGQ
jgi:hypothetical protein